MKAEVIVKDSIDATIPFHQIEKGCGFYYPHSGAYYLRLNDDSVIRLTAGKSSFLTLAQCLISPGTQVIPAKVTIEVESV